MGRMDQSDRASVARCRIVLEVMAKPDGDPVRKLAFINRLSEGDPKVRRMAKAVQSFYYPKGERLQL